MVECVIAVYALCWVQDEKLINEIQGVRIFDVSFQTVLHFPLLAFRQLHFLVELILIHTGPHLRQRGNSSEFS